MQLSGTVKMHIYSCFKNMRLLMLREKMVSNFNKYLLFLF